MIGSITGTPQLITEKYALLDVHGIGYKVFLTSTTLADIQNDDAVTLFTHLVVKEDALDLYGFKTLAECDFFELLISVSGVGPKGALGILSVSSLDNLKKAIASSEVSYLTQVSGIGRKTAEKIVIELRDKLQAFNEGKDGFIFRGDSDVIEALKALGYSHFDARDVVKDIPKEITDTNGRIKAALKMLAK